MRLVLIFNEQLGRHFSGNLQNFRNRIYRLLCTLLIFVPLLSHSQYQNLKFEHVGTEQGLSDSNTICSFQDSRGFMWFGTRDGLNKYDGYSFTVYKNNTSDKSSLSNDAINDIIEDADGMLWIATWGGGISRFDRDTEKFIHFKHNNDDRNTISSDLVNSIAFDNKGILWIGTEASGVDSYDSKNHRFTHYTHDSNNPRSLSQNSITDILVDSQQNIWIGTPKVGWTCLIKPKNYFRTLFTTRNGTGR